MENFCRKKYKQSPKKWISASSYPEFRRHLRLIPANAGLFHYAGNNPIRYIDPDGRSDFSFDYANYLRGQLKGFVHGTKASFQDMFGKFGNFFVTMFTKTDFEFYVEGELSLGPVSSCGTITVNSSGKLSFDVSEPTDVLLSEIEKIIGLPVTIDTNGISADIPITDGVFAVVGVEKRKEGGVKLKLGGKVSAEIDDMGSSLGAGAKIILKPSTQDGPFGTAENRKNEKLNDNMRILDYYNSMDFFIDNLWEY